MTTRNGARLVGLLLGAAVLPACIGDHFFHASGRVVECGAQTPLVAAAISAHLDKDGFGNPPRELPDAFTTDAQGRFEIDTAEEAGAWITLTFRQAGFTQLDTQVKGAPAHPLELCMVRTAAP
jgi:hypothetical protein